MIARLFNHRLRGFRTVNVVGFVLVMALAITVNLAKTYAGREAREIDRAERVIAQEKRRIRLLEAEVAHLEQPERLQSLAKVHLGMAPLSATREGDMVSLAILVAGGEPPPPVATPTPVGEEAIEVAGLVTAEAGDEPQPASTPTPPLAAVVKTDEAEILALAETGQ